MTFRYIVTDVKNHLSYTLLTLRPENRERLEFSAGQYATVSAKNGAFSTCTRCFSIVSSPNDKLLQIAFRRGGDLTNTIAQLYPGDPVNVQGPFGSFVLDKSSRPIVMFAGGIGITPLISMLRNLADNKSSRKVVLVASNSSPEETPLLNEILNLSRKIPSLRLELFSSRPSQGFKVGRITNQVIADIVTGTHKGVYYICGSENFSNAVKDGLLKAGVPEHNIKSESFNLIDKQTPPVQVANKVMKYSFLGFLGLLAIVAGGEFIKSFSSNLNNNTGPNINTAAANSAPTTTNSPTTTTSDDGTAAAPAVTTPTQTYTPPTTSTYTPPSSRAS